MEHTAPVEQFSVGNYFYISKVGKGLLQVAAKIIPIIWCASKIFMNPLFLYSYTIDKENVCLASSEAIWIVFKYFDEWSVVIDIMSLFSLVLRKCLFKKKIEKFAWVLLIAIDLWSSAATHLPMNKFLLMAMSLVWPYADGSNYYSTSGFLLQYLAVAYLMYISFERVARKWAILAKATWARVVFNLLLLCHVAHVFGGLWYAFAIAKNVDCWVYASEDTSSPYSWRTSYCGAVGKSSAIRTILKEICQTKSQNTTLFDFGIYRGANEIGIVEQPNFLLRILYCLYWGLLNLRGQFFGSAKDRWELIFLIFMLLLGVLIFAYLTGNILIYLLFRSQELEKTRQRKRETEKSRFFTNFPKDLRKEIKRFLPKKWEKDDDDHLQMIFLNLPDNILKKIKHKFFLEIIKEIEEFRSWSHELLDELCDKVIPVSYPRYTTTRTIQRQGSSIQQMLFVVCGKLQTCSSNWSIDYLQDKMFCGEELVDWFQADPYSVNRPISTRTVKTITKVDAFILEADDLQELFIKHRATSASIQEQAPPEPEKFDGVDDDEIVREGGSEDMAAGPSHPQIVGVAQTLESTDTERQTDYWKSFNPNNLVTGDVHKFGGVRSEGDSVNDNDGDDGDNDGTDDEVDDVKVESDDVVEGDSVANEDVQSMQSESEDSLSEFRTKRVHDVPNVHPEVKQLFEYIVNLQKTTNKKLSRMDKRHKATLKIAEDIDRRLRGVEEYIKRHLSSSDDSDEDDGDDDDHDGGSFVPEEHIGVPTTVQPAPSTLHQDKGVRHTPVHEDDKVHHTSLPEDEAVQQSVIDAGQSVIQQEIQDVGLAQGVHQSPHQLEEQEIQSDLMDIRGVADAEAERGDDQLQEEDIHERGKRKTKSATPLRTLYTDPGPAKKKIKIVQQQVKEVAQSVDPVEAVYNEYKASPYLDLRRAVERCGWYVIPTTLVTLEDDNSWLTSEHIDAYLMCIRKKWWNEDEDRRYALHGTSLFGIMTVEYNNQYVNQGKKFDPTTATIPSEWLPFGCGRIDASVPWWCVDNVLLPCSLNQQHWVLCRVCFKEKKIYVYDSLASTDIEERLQALEPLVCFMPIMLRFIGFYERTQLDMPAVDERWEVERLDRSVVPQQPDGTSCGAYVAMYVRDLLQSRESTWKLRTPDTAVDAIALRVEIARDIYSFSRPLYKVNNFGKWTIDSYGEVVYK